jgi:cytochrome c-type biogenesis protein CcmH/NrfF
MIRGSRSRKTLALSAGILLGLAAAVPLWPAAGDEQQPQTQDHAHQIGAKVRCMCGGCNDSAAGCYHIGGAFSGPCDTAKAELSTIDQHIAKGDSDDLIVQSFVQEFGPAVLIEPPHSGFAGLAWWVPGLAFAAGLAIVIAVIARWRKRVPPQPALATAGGHRGISHDLLERARAQAARDTED